MNGVPRILTIAGSDSSGGAGIQADVKTITMLGGYAMTAITAVTAQNTLGVSGVQLLPPAFVTAQIDACVQDIGVDAVKIGMLGGADIAEAVAERLHHLSVPIIFDPVMVATSGAALAPENMDGIFRQLMEIATLSTPNVHELAALGGDAAMRAAGYSYLAKGGDNAGPEVEDRLVRPNCADVTWRAPRIITRHTHGTGCTLASAIATHMGKGLSAEEAIGLARNFVRSALENAPEFGGGHGPMGHFAVKP